MSGSLWVFISKFLHQLSLALISQFQCLLPHSYSFFFFNFYFLFLNPSLLFLSLCSKLYSNITVQWMSPSTIYDSHYPHTPKKKSDLATTLISNNKKEGNVFMPQNPRFLWKALQISFSFLFRQICIEN